MAKYTLKLIIISISLLCADAALKSSTSKIYVGAGIEANVMNSEADYKKVLTENFNCVTPGNEMKWASIEGTKGTSNYGGGDAIVSYAQSNGAKVRGHTLVWHSQYPSWVDSVAKADFKAMLQKHVEDEVTHYKGKIYAWDVVNEVLNEDGTLRTSVFYNQLGKEYIADAFKWAHAIDGSAKLYINDYNVESKNKKSDGLLSLANELKSAGVPIHGVGFQAHFSAGHIPTDFASNMKRFADAGFDVAVTELDIQIGSSSELQQQAKDYAQVFKDCLSISRCVGVTVWGITDKHTWKPGKDPLLWDAQYKAKPAVAAIETALKG